MRTLIVDDSRFIRDYLRAMLEGMGMDCEVAGDGEQGLERLRRQGPFELALVDWNMPRMGGLEMVRRLRADPGFDGVRVLIVTTEAEHACIVAALDAGADEYLMKPFDREGLMRKLELMGFAEIEANGCQPFDSRSAD